MSVTIVTAIPKAPQAAAPAPSDVESLARIDTFEAGADFATLLKGQLAPVVPDALPEILVKTDSETPLDSTAPAAAVLIAALGIVPIESGRNTAAPPDQRSLLARH